MIAKFLVCTALVVLVSMACVNCDLASALEKRPSWNIGRQEAASAVERDLAEEETERDVKKRIIEFKKDLENELSKYKLVNEILAAIENGQESSDDDGYYAALLHKNPRGKRPTIASARMAKSVY